MFSFVIPFYRCSFFTSQVIFSPFLGFPHHSIVQFTVVVVVVFYKAYRFLLRSVGPDNNIIIHLLTGKVSFGVHWSYIRVWGGFFVARYRYKLFMTVDCFLQIILFCSVCLVFLHEVADCLFCCFSVAGSVQKPHGGNITWDERWLVSNCHDCGKKKCFHSRLWGPELETVIPQFFFFKQNRTT